MARTKKVTTKPKHHTKVVISNSKTKNTDSTFLKKIQTDLQQNQSYLNLVLGVLIVIVLGALVFNYFNKQKGNLGPAQQTQDNNQASSNNQSTKYTVKEGDTLFSIAQAVYKNGYQYPKITEANKLADENVIEVGQVLDIPRIDQTASSSNAPNTNPQTSPNNTNLGTGGAVNQTIWGEKITSDTYTVQPGDWLSKIAGRAYGDPMMFDKIAAANNIQNPDDIEVGIVLKIPK